MSEEAYIDLSNVPLKPIGKKEIAQLEMALIIGTLYRPEVLELIRDPVERSTWMDSLAVAAAAFARNKAGLTTSQISEELGRSEISIRSHLNQKTKAGKLVAETYEKLRKGELRLIVPFIRTPVAGIEEQLEALRKELEKYREHVKALEQQLENLKHENEDIKTKLTGKEAELEALRREHENLVKERDEVVKRLNTLIEEVKRVKQTLSEIVSTLDKITSSTS